MSEATISSLIALAGIFISVIASLFISLRQTRIETQQLRDEYMRQYAGKLLEKRIEVYPALSRLVVDVIHKINLSKVSAEDIQKFSQCLREWDAQNALFVSAQPQQIIHRLHLLFADLNKMETADLQKVLDNQESLRQIKHRLLELTLALKNDLGIFSVKSPSAIADTKAPSSYAEVDQLSGIKEKRYTIGNSPDQTD